MTSTLTGEKDLVHTHPPGVLTSTLAGEKNLGGIASTKLKAKPGLFRLASLLKLELRSINCQAYLSGVSEKSHLSETSVPSEDSAKPSPRDFVINVHI